MNLVQRLVRPIEAIGIHSRVRVETEGIQCIDKQLDYDIVYSCMKIQDALNN